MTNMKGSLNVIDAAIDKKVRSVVALSTDKASNAVDLYGSTELASDTLFVADNGCSGPQQTAFSVVRYGNNMGSHGSTIPFFMLIRDKGVIRITDRRMTRCMISFEEDVELVWHIFEDRVDGEVYAKRMPSMKVADGVVAQRAPEA
ncbi:Polysaccharide biosynthesis protein [Citreimonas salinaria]|uniref:Polysaccharide biosynthesis protein n=2 Tax=Citreimonas salinaria TaxID=321339 RepID=A0A1H3KWI3_9RHOB|nr:Polysaccharide biosynthesis protein [Citreimonas salinaria]